MKRVLTALLFIVVCSSGALAGKDAVPSNWQEAAPEGLAEAGFALMLKGDYVKMAEEWFSHFDPALISKDQIDLAKRQFVVQMPMAGKAKRYELVSRKQYGKSIVRLKYLVVTEKFPLFFSFYYYKPDQEWTTLNVTFSDKFMSLEE